MRTTIGLRLMKKTELFAGFETIYQGREDTWDLETNASTYHFFKRTNQPARANESATRTLRFPAKNPLV